MPQSFILENKNTWWVYILRCKNDKLYTGISNDPIARFNDHCKGKGAKFTKANPPEAIVYLEECANKSAASKRECAIKKLSRAQKLKLIIDNPIERFNNESL